MFFFSISRNLIQHMVQLGIALSEQVLVRMSHILWEVSYTSPSIRSTSFSSGQLLNQ
ncbi:Dynein light chain type 1 [Musa troglodytarum]|uniref:Dynein light chain type 1 n=2 Tax=Musa troglodytarum TaxID=320322 RepID=A0A9E7GQ73_9LILI|nr:Dynein light chain type 1 [Musa troglodytarum]